MMQIVYVGDIHGNLELLKREITRLKIGGNSDVTYVIQVGDFGVGFEPTKDLEKLLHLNKFFKLKNIICIAIRGNHDDPIYFKGEHIFSNLKLVEDYTVMDLHGKNHLFVGGAISIDRSYRLANEQEAASYGLVRKSFWYDEIFILDEEKLKTISNIDIVITHTAPQWCFPTNVKGFGDLVDSYAGIDKDLYNDLIKEREDMNKMFEILEKNGNKISEHYYGHYHMSNIQMNGYCNHYLLNINEFR